MALTGSPRSLENGPAASSSLGAAFLKGAPLNLVVSRKCDSSPVDQFDFEREFTRLRGAQCVKRRANCSAGEA